MVDAKDQARIAIRVDRNTLNEMNKYLEWGMKQRTLEALLKGFISLLDRAASPHEVIGAVIDGNLDLGKIIGDAIPGGVKKEG